MAAMLGPLFLFMISCATTSAFYTSPFFGGGPYGYGRSLYGRSLYGFGGYNRFRGFGGLGFGGLRGGLGFRGLRSGLGFRGLRGGLGFRGLQGGLGLGAGLRLNSGLLPGLRLDNDFGFNDFNDNGRILNLGNNFATTNFGNTFGLGEVFDSPMSSSRSQQTQQTIRQPSQSINIRVLPSASNNVRTVSPQQYIISNPSPRYVQTSNTAAINQVRSPMTVSLSSPSTVGGILYNNQAGGLQQGTGGVIYDTQATGLRTQGMPTAMNQNTPTTLTEFGPAALPSANAVGGLSGSTNAWASGLGNMAGGQGDLQMANSLYAGSSATQSGANLGGSAYSPAGTGFGDSMGAGSFMGMASAGFPQDVNTLATAASFNSQPTNSVSGGYLATPYDAGATIAADATMSANSVDAYPNTAGAQASVDPYLATQASTSSVGINTMPASSSLGVSSSTAAQATVDPYTGAQTTSVAVDPYTGSQATTVALDPYTGAQAASVAVDPYTGSQTASVAVDPYTGAQAATVAVDPYTGAQATTGTVDPYTGAQATTGATGSSIGSGQVGAAMTTSSMETYPSTTGVAQGAAASPTVDPYLTQAATSGAAATQQTTSSAAGQTGGYSLNLGNSAETQALLQQIGTADLNTLMQQLSPADVNALLAQFNPADVDAMMQQLNGVDMTALLGGAVGQTGAGLGAAGGQAGAVDMNALLGGAGAQVGFNDQQFGGAGTQLTAADFALMGGAGAGDLSLLGGAGSQTGTVQLGGLSSAGLYTAGATGVPTQTQTVV